MQTPPLPLPTVPMWSSTARHWVIINRGVHQMAAMPSSPAYQWHRLPRWDSWFNNITDGLHAKINNFSGRCYDGIRINN
uniref:Uncharacterized protein n=1 Tax=Caenorhabditis japonica TaxID=281687 RepID=A0A8R1EQM3_CAEJA